jgi:hypothetical protein
MANHAILIGVSHYYDQQIKDLPHSVHSIKQLHNTLIEKESFEPTNILVLSEKVILMLSTTEKLMLTALR